MGIGAVYADRLAKRGHDLVLVARSQEKLTDVARMRYRLVVSGPSYGSSYEGTGALIVSQRRKQLIVKGLYTRSRLYAT